jgi:hypothetical protein
LRQDDDAGQQAEPGRDAGDEGEEGERLVQDTVERVDARQVGIGGRVGAHHVVGGDEKVVAEVLDGLRVGPQAGHVRAHFVLGQNRADLHRDLLGARRMAPCRLHMPEP